MTLQEFYWFSSGLASLVLTIFFIVLIVVFIWLGSKLEKILDKTNEITTRALIASDITQNFIANLIDKIKHYNR